MSGGDLIAEILVNLLFFGIKETVQYKCGISSILPLIIWTSMILNLIILCAPKLMIRICCFAVNPVTNLVLLVITIICFARSWSCVSADLRWLGYISHLILLCILICVNVLSIFSIISEKNKQNQKSGQDGTLGFTLRGEPDIEDGVSEGIIISSSAPHEAPGSTPHVEILDGHMSINSNPPKVPGDTPICDCENDVIDENSEENMSQKPLLCNI
ncbi:unnamed protein product [Moneuplotes crassus]|uniref:Uncharacterized protein n=1 Tax=Euplotes crassus TaxID=5936 RepID=A0AAD2CYR6_EUPCR|nr:unnamed protein product [Moneuplotes crassus]